MPPIKAQPPTSSHASSLSDVSGSPEPIETIASTLEIIREERRCNTHATPPHHFAIVPCCHISASTATGPPTVARSHAIHQNTKTKVVDWPGSFIANFTQKQQALEKSFSQWPNREKQCPQHQSPLNENSDSSQPPRIRLRRSSIRQRRSR